MITETQFSPLDVWNVMDSFAHAYFLKDLSNLVLLTASASDR